MSSIVLDLQAEITSPDCDVVNMLRRAHIIAVKLGLNEFDQWISYELKGYPNQDVCPDYRKTRGILKALNPYRGWIPVYISDSKFERAFSEIIVQKSISEIVSLCKTTSDVLQSELSGEQLTFLRRKFYSTSSMEYPLSLFVPKTAIMDIVEKVKNTVLEWTLKLEGKNIVGQDMKFSESEKKSAKEIPQTVNNYYGVTNVINAPSNRMQIISGNESVSFSYNNASLALTEIENAIKNAQIEPDDREKVIELLSEIRDKIKEEKKPSVIKASFEALKDFLIGVGCEVIANLIQTKMLRMF